MRSLAPVATGGISTTVLIVFGGIMAAAVTGLFVLLSAKRLNSGSPRTSTATDLWNESNAMRAELRDRLVAAEAKAEQASRDVAEARAEADQWRQRAMAMEDETAKMKRQIASLQRQVHAMKKEKQ